MKCHPSTFLFSRLEGVSCSRVLAQDQPFGAGKVLGSVPAALGCPLAGDGGITHQLCKISLHLLCQIPSQHRLQRALMFFLCVSHWCPQVQLQLLTAIVKLFLKKPTETQELVQQVLSLATQVGDSSVPSKASLQPC